MKNFITIVNPYIIYTQSKKMHIIQENNLRIFYSNVSLAWSITSTLTCLLLSLHFASTYYHAWIYHLNYYLVLSWYKKIYVLYFQVPFTEALELVRSRKVYIADGFAYVPHHDLVVIIVTLFRSRLSHALAVSINLYMLYMYYYDSY